MIDVFVYRVKLPEGIHEMVTPCIDGYTVYLNVSDSTERQRRAYEHALRHIARDDFSRDNVQDIEFHAHKMPR